MLRELKTLIAVARYGTFAAAGVRIGLTQSAISSQMQRLEEDLGIQLFLRTGRSAILNAAGHQAVELATQMLELYGRMGKEAGSAALRGTVRVAAIQSAQSRLMPGTLALLQDRHPDIHVKLSAGSSLPIVGQIDSGEMDIGILVAPPFDLSHELQWRPLMREPFVLITPKREHGSNWRQLIQEQPFLLYERQSFGGRQVMRFLKQEHLEPQVCVEVEEIDTIVDLVSQGLGVSLVPSPRARWDVRRIPLDNDSLYRDIGFVVKSDLPNPGPVRALANALIESAGSQPDAHPDLVRGGVTLA